MEADAYVRSGGHIDNHCRNQQWPIQQRGVSNRFSTNIPFRGIVIVTKLFGRLNDGIYRLRGFEADSAAQRPSCCCGNIEKQTAILIREVGTVCTGYAGDGTPHSFARFRRYLFTPEPAASSAAGAFVEQAIFAEIAISALRRQPPHRRKCRSTRSAERPLR